MTQTENLVAYYKMRATEHIQEAHSCENTGLLRLAKVQRDLANGYLAKINNNN